MKVLISDLLLFVFQFHILFAQLWIRKDAVFTLLCRLKCLLNLSLEIPKVSSELLEKIKYESFLVRKFSSASWPTGFSWPVHRLLTLLSTTYHLALPREKYSCNTITVRRCTPTEVRRVRSANNCTYRRNKSLL